MKHVHYARGVVLAALCVSGCGAPTLRDRNPEVSEIRVDAQAIPEVARVQVPMPPTPVEPVPLRAERASLWSADEGGYFADRRAQEVGDILTILIDIDDEAELSNRSDRRRSGDASLGTPTFLGADRILDAFANEDGTLVDVEAGASANGSGSIGRRESINLTIAATVIQALPNGNLVVAGRQEVMVNAELRELRIAGIIRPSDILSGNRIPYERIAEARITYGGRGQLSRQVRGSYGDHALDVVLPF